MPCDGCQSLLAGRCAVDDVAAQAQEQRQALLNQRIVIDDKDAGNLRHDVTLQGLHHSQELIGAIDMVTTISY